MHRPETLDEVAALLASTEDAMVYGGGTAIQILRKQGILFTDDFIDISRIPGLHDITVTDEYVTVGAMVSVREMEQDPRIRSAIPLASAAYSRVANPRVRNTASVAGNIAHGDYRLDPPTSLLVLDATVIITSIRGTRELPIREFFVDFQATDVAEDEMISAIRIPTQQQHRSAGRFMKFSSLSANDWPCASVAALATEHSGSLTVQLGLGALAPTSVYLSLTVDPTVGDQEIIEAALDLANSAIDPIADVRGGVEYKARIGRVIVEDAVRSVLKEVPRA
ncbi:molybdopterin dehydrogenase [Cryobacterium sp. Hh7]|uniref:FAD binding domain-containing protein n=1 Tax=Cryobacterium sp. Hh7 TaxID=1259159 RepID=UPI00106BE7C0|nr:FAD binding domain-containing protein [Cryobacterium sp. Hh7]TFD56960.1 molybdopterin dehydrogenase [Cryobacterium sp. Hh7]